MIPEGANTFGQNLIFGRFFEFFSPKMAKSFCLQGYLLLAKPVVHPMRGDKIRYPTGAVGGKACGKDLLMVNAII